MSQLSRRNISKVTRGRFTYDNIASFSGVKSLNKPHKNIIFKGSLAGLRVVFEAQGYILINKFLFEEGVVVMEFPTAITARDKGTLKKILTSQTGMIRLHKKTGLNQIICHSTREDGTEYSNFQIQILIDLGFEKVNDTLVFDLAVESESVRRLRVAETA